MVKPLKSKKCLRSVRNLKVTIKSEIDCLENVYELCLAKMKEKDPNFLPPVGSTTCCEKPASVTKCHKEVQVPSLNMIPPNLPDEEMILNSVSILPDEGNIPNSVSILPGIETSLNGETTDTQTQNEPQFSPSNEIVSKDANSASKIIKIEDSSSEESSHSLERVKTEKVVHKMIAPKRPQDSLYSKSMLHYVVLENLPPHTTVDDVVNELFNDLLGIESHEMTGVTIHSDRTECYAQIYFQDFRHVQVEPMVILITMLEPISHSGPVAMSIEATLVAMIPALQEDKPHESYLQTLLRKGAKREVPYVVNVHVPDDIQKLLNIEFSANGLSLDRPWKTIPKKLLLENVKILKSKSPFFLFADNIKMLRDPDILIGLDTSNLKNLTNYWICVSQEGRTAILEEMKTLHKRIMDHIDKSFTRQPTMWESSIEELNLGSGKSIDNRPLITCEWVGKKIDRMNSNRPLNFSSLDAGSKPHTSCSITDSGRTKYQLVKAVVIHTDSQAAPETCDSEAQTTPEIPMNASTQFNPEIDAQEKEERIQNQALPAESELATEIKRQYDKIMPALTYNSAYDLYKNDFEDLAKGGQKANVVFGSNYKHFMTLVSTMCDRNKHITCTAWHPGLCGVVAVAYGENVIFKNNELISDSDDSDYEVKASKPEEYVPKINPYLQANEIAEAALWKEASCELLEHFDKKEDDSSYKLGLITLAYLNQAQKIRDKEIQLEKQLEECKPEMDEMDFTIDYDYSSLQYDESTYDCQEDLLYKFRLDEYSNVPPDLDAPEESTIQKFEDKLTPYQKKDKIAMPHENKTFNIVWDGAHWNLGFALREEAFTIHRRSFNDAIEKVGPLLEMPKPKTFCPFLRVKRPEYRVTKTSNKSKRAKTKRSSRSTIHLHGGSDEQDTKKKKPEKHLYIEITDDEDMEISEREFSLVETGPTNFVYIWSISNDLVPLLKCVSPYEVSALNFCPHNGDILVAGTVSGQIVLWDLQGCLLSKEPQEPTHFERHAWKELKRKTTWYRELKVPGRLKETAVSAMIGAHFSKVISIQWVHPQLKFEEGHFINLVAENDLADSYSMQFLSTSVNGDIKCWDLKGEPLPKFEYMFAERTIARKMKNAKPELLTATVSKYAEYHNRWIPYYNLKEPVFEGGKGAKCQTSLLASSVQFHGSRLTYEREDFTEQRPNEKMSDIVKYKYKQQLQEDVTSSQTAFMGNMLGVVAMLSWTGQPLNPKAGTEPVDFEVLQMSVMEAVHDGPIIGVLRHPFISDVALSVGGHIFAIWNYKEMTTPIMWKRYFGKQITCCSWSPLKPSLFRIGLTDGTVEIWDLILQSHEPKVVIPAAGSSITGFTSHTLPLPNGLLGVLDENSSVLLYYIPWIYQSWRKHELDSLREMLSKEPARKFDLRKWGEQWRETHVRLNKLGGFVEPAKAQPSITEDDSSTAAKKPRGSAEEDSILKIGGFEPRKNVLPRDCKAYYRELYKWYLRRRGRTTRLMDERDKKIYEEEEKAIIKELLKNKRIDMGQLHKTMMPLVQNENRLKAKEGRVIAMMAQADRIFKNAVAKIFNVVKYQVSFVSKESLTEQQESSRVDDFFEVIENYFGETFETAEERLRQKLAEIQFAEKKFQDLVRERMKQRELFNDRRRFWDPEEKWMRIMARNLIEESGLICGQWQPHELNYEYRKYAHRSVNIQEYKKLFGEEYDPLWDIDNKPSTLKDFPYKWPYVTLEELPGGKADRPVQVANSSSALDLDFIVSAEEDVVALMLHEQQRQPAAEDDNVTLDDVEDRLPKTRSVPLSSSQLSLFQEDESTQELLQPDVEILVKDEEDVQSINDQDGDVSPGDIVDSVRMIEGSLARVSPETAASELLEFQSSKDIGIRSRSRIIVAGSDQLIGENEMLGEDEETGAKSKIEEESIGTSGEQLHYPQGTSKGLQLDSDALIIGEKGSLGGDPSYPEIWRDFSEDECISEGESIPSPRSSPSNVTDFSEITEVELYVPSDAEDEPYMEYYDESALAPTGPTSAKRPSQTGHEEPTEEYMGDSDSDDGLDSRGDAGEDSAIDSTAKRTRRKSVLGGRPVATPPSESSDDEA